MRRANHLFEGVVDRENLRLATIKALLSKRSKPDARRFVADLDAKLDSIRAGLLAGDLTLGSSIQFTIHDPKKRLITAPCFRERVIHHAIMNFCEPVFDRWLIADTYACRRGKGRNAALARAREFAGRFPFFLKMDVRKYFDSISHVVLNARLARLFKDRRLLDLFGRIIACHDVTRERGLPIGSLTSQHFANFYLGWFDRFVKETLRVPGYVRYMDDCVLWGESSRELGSKLASCREFLSDKLELTTKADPYINRTTHGMDFLGCRVFRSHLELNRRSRVRFVRKLQGLGDGVSRGRDRRISASGTGNGLGGVREVARSGQLAIPSPRVRTRWVRRREASDRVIRGGSWNNNPRNARSANRNRNTPENRNNNLGFRLALAQRSWWIPRLFEPTPFPSRSHRAKGKMQGVPPGARSQPASAPGGR